MIPLIGKVEILRRDVEITQVVAFRRQARLAERL